MPVNDKKRAYGSKLIEYVENYKAIFIVGVDNVGSRQMQQVRARARACVGGRRQGRSEGRPCRCGVRELSVAPLQP